MAHNNITKHGQRNSQPHCYRVTCDDEVGVEKQIYNPAVRMIIRPVRDRNTVEINRIWQIGDHRQHVCCCQRRQYIVCGRDHVFLCENNYIHKVTNNTNSTDNDTDIAMYSRVPNMKLLQCCLRIHEHCPGTQSRAAVPQRGILAGLCAVPGTVRGCQVIQTRRWTCWTGPFSPGKEMDGPIAASAGIGVCLYLSHPDVAWGTKQQVKPALQWCAT